MRLAFALIGALLLASCAQMGGLSARSSTDEAVLALETRIFILSEEERLRINPDAKPLMLDPELVDVARIRSQDMARSRSLAHAGAGGDTMTSFLIARDPKFQGLLSENVASASYTEEAGFDPDAMARLLVDTWLASPEHKANLALGAYDRTGIGVAVNGGAIYVSQIFATDLGLPPAPDAAPAPGPADKPAPVPVPRPH